MQYFQKHLNVGKEQSPGKPILYLGVGQRYSDLIEFDADWMVRKLFGEEEFEFSTEREF